MSMVKNYGSKVANPTKEIFDLFKPVEGLNTVYYGPVRNGKTRNATADIIELLKQGEIVYANWNIAFDGYDERESLGIAFLKLITGKKFFYRFDKANFHYFSPDEIDVFFLGRLVGVHIFVDEGQWIFNSHVRAGADDPETVAKRKLILHGGHYCRSLNVITQRPSNLFKDIRSQINIWYRCQKRLDLGPLMIFQRWAIQDMKDDLPVEYDSEGKPLGELKTYYVNKYHDEVFKSYNTHAMRTQNAIVKPPILDVYELNWLERVKLVASHFKPRKRAFKPVAGAVEVADSLPVERERSIRKLVVNK